jgi:hypothetical protein
LLVGCTTCVLELICCWLYATDPSPCSLDLKLLLLIPPPILPVFAGGCGCGSFTSCFCCIRLAKLPCTFD